MTTIYTLLRDLPLERGTHKTNSGALSLMEAVAYVAGEPHTDHPECACPVITEVAAYADFCYVPQVKIALAQRVLQIAGSKSSDDVQFDRLCLLADHTLHVVLPEELQKRSAALVARLRALPKITRDNCVQVLSAAGAEFDLPDKLMLDETVQRQLQRALDQVRLGQYGNAARELVFLFMELDAVLGVVTLLDQLLAVGKTLPLEPTEEVRARLGTLSQRPKPWR